MMISEPLNHRPDPIRTAQSRRLIYLLAASPVLAAALEWSIEPSIDVPNWFFYYPAVFIASWIGGRTCGLLATVFSAVLAWLTFVSAKHGATDDSDFYLSGLFFVAFGIAFSLVHERFRNSASELLSLLTNALKRNKDLVHNLDSYMQLFTLAPDSVFVADSKGRLIDVNNAACALLNLPRSVLLTRDMCALVAPVDQHLLDDAARRLRFGQTLRTEITLIRHPDATVICEISAVLLPDGRVKALVRDIDSRKQAEVELRQAEIVFRNTGDGIMITDASARIISVNAALVKMSGYSRDELIGSNPRLQKSGRHDETFYYELWSSLASNGQWHGEVWNRRKNGDIYPVWQYINAVYDQNGKVSNYVSVLSDISAIKHAESELEHLAHHDVLTGLPNRLQFELTLQQAVDRTARSHSRLAVLFIDLDNFKLVNDSMGHATGDELLCEIGARLQACIRSQDSVARLGGDEFTVILEGVVHPDDAAGVAKKILTSLCVPFAASSCVLTATASIGIAIYPEDAKTVEELTRNADAALYRAKDRGRNTFDFYSPELTVRANARLRLEHDLRRALLNNELALHYQPQFDATSAELCGFEALIRWNDPTLGLVLPDTFIPVAEESQLIGLLGDWVLMEACRQTRAWLDAGLAPKRVSINVSGRQLLDESMLAKTEAAMRLYGLVGCGVSLVFELTETVLLSVKPEQHILERLRKLDVAISIDDFGTGYSSLSTLQHLPVTSIKVAQAFMNGVPNDHDNGAIVETILAIGRALDLLVIAEGVETQAQLTFMRNRGCQEIQGHIFSKALTPLQASHLMEGNRAPELLASMEVDS